MKNRIRLLIIILALTLQAGCVPQSQAPSQERVTGTPSTQAAEPVAGQIQIGILAPLTGPVATFGASTRKGVELAIDEWNAQGGVLGRKVVPVWGDSQCDKNQAVSAANQLIHDDRVRYIVGDICSGASIGLAEIAEEQQVIQISPASTFDGLTLNPDGSTRKYVFRVCYTDSFQGSVAGKFAALYLNDRRAFVLRDPEDGYTVGLAKFFEQSFTQSGGSIVGQAEYSHKDTDFSVILAQITAAQPDIVFLGDAYTQVNALVAQARAKGITAPFIGGDGWDSPDLDRKATDGSYFTTHFSPDDQRPGVQAWLKKYQTRYQAAPDALAVLGYDATNLLLEAITQTGVDDTSKVAGKMAGLQWEGVSGTIRFDPQHNPIKPVVVMQVKDGQVRYVTTVTP